MVGLCNVQYVLMFFFNLSCCRHAARPEITDGHLNNVLHDAAVTSDPSYLSVLCELEIDEMAVNKQNADGVTPLMLACQHEASNKVESLLKKKVN